MKSISEVILDLKKDEVVSVCTSDVITKGVVVEVTKFPKSGEALEVPRMLVMRADAILGSWFAGTIYIDAIKIDAVVRVK